MKKYVVLVVLAAAVWSCKKTSNPVSPNAASYFPMSAGSTWTYSSYGTDSSGAEVPGTESVEFDSVMGQTTFQGRTATMVYTKQDTVVSTAYFSQATNGDIWTFADTSSTGTPKGFWQLLYTLSNASAGATATTRDTIVFAQIGFPISVPLNTTDKCNGTNSLSVTAGTYSVVEHDEAQVADFTGTLVAGSTYVINATTFFSGNIGVVKEVTSTSISINVPPPFNSYSFSNKSGTVKQLTSVHIL